MEKKINNKIIAISLPKEKFKINNSFPNYLTIMDLPLSKDLINTLLGINVSTISQLRNSSLVTLSKKAIFLNSQQLKQILNLENIVYQSSVSPKDNSCFPELDRLSIYQKIEFVQENIEKKRHQEKVDYVISQIAIYINNKSSDYPFILSRILNHPKTLIRLLSNSNLNSTSQYQLLVKANNNQSLTKLSEQTLIIISTIPPQILVSIFINNHPNISQRSTANILDKLDNEISFVILIELKQKYPKYMQSLERKLDIRLLKMFYNF